MEGSGCLMQWYGWAPSTANSRTPPDPLVFHAFPSLYVHPRLAETFERPVSRVRSILTPSEAHHSHQPCGCSYRIPRLGSGGALDSAYGRASQCFLAVCDE